MFTRHLAHHFWKQYLSPGDIAIDATCGNGHDVLILSSLALGEGDGRLFVLDIQDEAIASGKRLTEEKLKAEELEKISWHCQCHSTFPNEIDPETVSLAVYNLGYLPGGDKSVTTERSTTLQSVQSAMKLIKVGGAISITCYPGHEEGEFEENELLKFAKELNPREWSCSFHQWINRNKAPSLLLIQKQKRK